MSGRKMAWNRTWKTSGRQLSEQVVVSVAVDIEARHGPGFLVSGEIGEMVTAKEDGDWCWKIITQPSDLFSNSTLWLFNIAMENVPFILFLMIKNCDSPVRYVK